MLRLLKKAPARFWKSFGYSWDGLRAVFVKEESFRLELIAFAILLAVMALCPWPVWKKLAMVIAFLAIPTVEILNSALEDICDCITTAHHPLVKSAKDKGALAVLAAIVLNGLILILLTVV